MKYLDLFIRVKSFEEQLQEAHQEIQMLSEVNEEYRSTLDTRKIIQAGRDERARKQEDFNRSLSELSRGFTDSLHGVNPEAVVKRWMRDLASPRPTYQDEGLQSFGCKHCDDCGGEWQRTDEKIDFHFHAFLLKIILTPFFF